MAKHDKHDSNPGETPAAAPVATPVATVPDDRYVMVTTDGQYGTTAGAQVKRIDLIRQLWAAGNGRGAIAKYLTQISGKKIPYQIVFSGTKGLPGGPPKQAAVAAPVPASS